MINFGFRVAIGAVALCLSGIATAATLKCIYTEGSFHAWGEATTLNHNRLELIFDAIDEKAGTARLIGNAGTSDVSLIEDQGRLTFLELTNSSNINMTTVYRANGSTFKSVHSRHVGTMQQPLLSQMYGTCSVF